MTSDSKQPDVLTTRDAAKLLGVSVKTAQLWVETGRIRAWKTPGGHRRILRSSVDALIDDAAHEGGAGEHGHHTSEGAFRVVLIEDDPTLLQLYQLALSDLPGLQLHAVESCFTGLLRIGEHHPHLVITDLRMPGFDGFEMIRSIKSDEVLSDTPVTAITGMTEAEIEARGGLPEGVFVLHKPVGPSSLRDFVGQACEHVRRAGVERG